MGDPKWRAVIWCPDCLGEDPLGCGDGDVWHLGPFDSKAEAEEAGDAEVDEGIWRYRAEPTTEEPRP